MPGSTLASRRTKSNPVVVLTDRRPIDGQLQHVIQHFGVVCNMLTFAGAAALSRDDLRKTTGPAALVVVAAEEKHAALLAEILAMVPNTLLWVPDDQPIGDWLTPLAERASSTLMTQPTLARWTNEVDPAAACNWLRTLGIDVICRQRSMVVGTPDGEWVSVRRIESLINDSPDESLATFVGALAAMRACGERWTDAIELADACGAIGIETAPPESANDLRQKVRVRSRRPFSWPSKPSRVPVSPALTAAGLLLACGVVFRVGVELLA